MPADMWRQFAYALAIALVFLAGVAFVVIVSPNFQNGCSL